MKTWKHVDAPTTASIANRCSAYINFTGCSKKEVLKTVYDTETHKQRRTTTDVLKFEALMDAANAAIPGLRRQYEQGLKEVFDAVSRTLVSSYMDPNAAYKVWGVYVRPENIASLGLHAICYEYTDAVTAAAVTAARSPDSLVKVIGAMKLEDLPKHINQGAQDIPKYSRHETSDIREHN